MKCHHIKLWSGVCILGAIAAVGIYVFVSHSDIQKQPISPGWIEVTGTSDYDGSNLSISANISPILYEEVIASHPIYILRSVLKDGVIKEERTFDFVYMGTLGDCQDVEGNCHAKETKYFTIFLKDYPGIEKVQLYKDGNLLIETAVNVNKQGDNF